MSVRKVVTRSGRHIRGYFPSIKMNRMVAWESLLERDAIVLFEMSPGVLSYEEQPSIETYYENAQPRRYFPDFSLTLSNGEVIHIEVKPSRTLERKRTRDRYTLIANQYARQERNFWILSDNEIRREPRLSNLKLLAYHRRMIKPDLRNNEMLELLRRDGAMQFSNLAQIMNGMARALQLMAAGYVHCDLDHQITPQTVIHALEEGAKNDALYF